jgi:hypothetical protein
MPWSLTLEAAEADGGGPVSGIPVLEATPQGAQLAATDSSGTACVVCDVDTSGNNALYISTTRFSMQQTGPATSVTVYDEEIYKRLIAQLPPYGDDPQTWSVAYSIADSRDGSPITGISAIDPLVGRVFGGTTSQASTATTTQASPITTIDVAMAEGSRILAVNFDHPFQYPPTFLLGS